MPDHCLGRVLGHPGAVAFLKLENFSLARLSENPLLTNPAVIDSVNPEEILLAISASLYRLERNLSTNKSAFGVNLAHMWHGTDMISR